MRSILFAWDKRAMHTHQMTLHLSYEHHLKPLEIQYRRTFVYTTFPYIYITRLIISSAGIVVVV